MGCMESEEGYAGAANPTDLRMIKLRLRDALELSVDAAEVYSARSPWKEDARRPAILLQAEEAHEFHLAAFQVLTVDILPTEGARR
jgi:hypothetical protein